MKFSSCCSPSGTAEPAAADRTAAVMSLGFKFIAP